MAEPKVRFKRDDGSSYPSYSVKTLGNCFAERNQRSSGSEELLAVTQARGVILQSETDKRNVSSSDKSNYKVVCVGDIAYNSMRMWQGAEGVSAYDGIVSPAYTIISPRGRDIDAYYFEKYFKTHKLLKIFERNSQGITSDTWNLKYPAFSRIKVNVPCVEEQNKVASFLSSVDEVIDASEEEVANLETQKKVVSKKIFSQEVRFKKADGSDFPAWEDTLLGDHLIPYTEITTVNNQYPPLTSSRQGLFMQEDYFKKQVASEDNTGYNIVPYGYFTYRHMSDDTIFRFNINYLVENGIVSTLYPVFTTDDFYVDRFLQYYLNESPDFAKYCVLQKQGGSRTYMYFSKLIKYTGRMPSDIEEQRLIAEFLSAFDDAIKAAKKELELWKELKKGLLQQMFV